MKSLRFIYIISLISCFLNYILLSDETHAMVRKTDTLYDILSKDERFSTLLHAFKKSGTLKNSNKPVHELLLMSNGQITLFAPTNEAFENLEQDILRGLLENPSKLQELISLHVVPAKLLSENIKDQDNIPTLKPHEDVVVKTKKVNNEEEKIFINDAKIIHLDIETANGVVHVIDKVLIPSDLELRFD